MEELSGILSQRANEGDQKELGDEEGKDRNVWLEERIKSTKLTRRRARGAWGGQ
jgi:hypothetical protein